MSDTESSTALRVTRFLDALYRAALDPCCSDGSIEWFMGQTGIDLSEPETGREDTKERADALARLLDRLRALVATDDPPARRLVHDRAEISLLRRLLPHVERAVELRRRMRGLDRAGNPLATAADRLTTGVVLLRDDGRPVFANAEAQRILAEGDGLGLSPSGLRAWSRTANATLQRALERALRAAGPIADEVSLAVPRRTSERPYIVSVAPRLLAGERGAWVLITDLERAGPSALSLRDAFGLTPAESRLAARLASGEPLTRAAEAEGIRVGTARVHLKSLFRKTGCHRQGQLVSVLLRTCPPGEPA